LLAGKNRIQKSLTRLAEKGKITDRTSEEIMSRLSCTTDLAVASDSDIVVEAVVENMNVKKDIFATLGAVCRHDCILASNTSSLSITEIASTAAHPERVLGLHFFNPAPVMKLVEVISGLNTAPEVITKAAEIVKDLGKQPVNVKEAPGFVVNRLLIPMINEAVEILAEGVASAEDIDKAMMMGANHPMGPLALSDLIGNDIVLAIMEAMLQETRDPKYRPSILLRKMVHAGRLGKKTKSGFYHYEQSVIN
jgi:3-hydroxybutyryl-CoA dehydrogenase